MASQRLVRLEVCRDLTPHEVVSHKMWDDDTLLALPAVARGALKLYVSLPCEVGSTRIFTSFSTARLASSIFSYPIVIYRAFALTRCNAHSLLRLYFYFYFYFSFGFSFFSFYLLIFKVFQPQSSIEMLYMICHFIDIRWNWNDTKQISMFLYLTEQKLTKPLIYRWQETLVLLEKQEINPWTSCLSVIFSPPFQSSEIKNTPLEIK